MIARTDFGDTLHQRGISTQQAHRSSTEYCDSVASLEARVCEAPPGSGEDVGKRDVIELLVGAARDLQEVQVGA